MTFEVRGRIGYDYVKIGGAQLHSEEFERVAAELDLYFTDFRVEAKIEESAGVLQTSLRLIVLPRGLLLQDPAVQKIVAREFERRLFVTPAKTLHDLVVEGSFLPLRLELATGPFPIQHKTVKIKLAHD